MGMNSPWRPPRFSICSRSLVQPTQISATTSAMNKTFASSTNRMYFSVHFTKNFLLPFLNPSTERLRLKLGGTSIRQRVCLMKGTDGRATITTNWTHFVRAAQIKEAQIFAFVFTARNNKLRLTVSRKIS